MGSDIGGKALFAVLLLTALGVGFVVLQDLSAKPCPWRRRVAALGALFLVTAGLTLTLSPYTASTGAECDLSPTTSVLGPEGSQARIDEAPDETDRASTESCTNQARARTAAAAALVLLGSVGYAIVRRPLVREPSVV
ncbi:hypothetical protein [Cellulomonas sp. PhB150]|uniref:hypothetical protein n=1 Tax=Cellulomonas sp. PhB150 TaxID=2485188 RepID=UPI000F462D1D|nr:hypothetical protein [Cellulomonas sp. PhB150]ROS27986.1 hypothetical protein EDF34_1782 [Cellulomonas sp. PhB150]